MWLGPGSLIVTITFAGFILFFSSALLSDLYGVFPLILTTTLSGRVIFPTSRSTGEEEGTCVLLVFSAREPEVWATA